MASPAFAAAEGTLSAFLEACEDRPDLDPLKYLVDVFTNPDVESRVGIANWMLDQGADASMTSGNERVNALHVLFSQREHDFEAEAPLLRRLFEGGADINGYSPKWGRPLHVLMENRGLRDRLLGPFYDVIFAQPGIDWDAPVSLKSETEKRTLRDSVEAAEGRRPEMARRMREYEAHGPSPLP